MVGVNDEKEDAMTHQWTPPQQPPMPPGGGGGGNGLMYELIGLVGVLIVTIGVVAALVLGVGDDSGDDADLVATQAPPAPPAAAGEDADRPQPTEGAAPRETVTETERVRDSGSDDSDDGFRSRVWGDSSVHTNCRNGALTGSANTSCAFARRVSDEVWEGTVGVPHRTVRAYSPVTGRTYTMNCTLGSMNGRDATYRCTGGNNAIVFVPVAG